MRAPSQQPLAHCALCVALVVLASLSHASRTLAATACTAADFACPASGQCVISGAWDVGTGCTLDFGERRVALTGTLRTSERGGDMTLVAGSLTIAGGQIDLRGDREMYGGFLKVTLSGPFVMQGEGARILGDANYGGAEVMIASRGAVLGSGLISLDGGVGEDCGEAGLLDLDAGDGTLRIENKIRARTGGRDCEGGELDLRGASVEVSGVLDVSGGAGASDVAIDIEALDGDLTVTKNARLRADGTGQFNGGGTVGGDVFLYARGNIDLAGPVSSRARGWQGIGGYVQLQADGAVDVSGNVRARAAGGSGGGFFVSASGPTHVRSRIDASGSNRLYAHGGDIQIYSASELSVSGMLDSSGREATQLYLLGNPLRLTGSVVTRAMVGEAYVQLMGCSTTIDGTIDTRSASGDSSAATVAIYSADTQITSTARIVSGAGPCSFTLGDSCIALATNSGGLDIAPGAVIDPQPSVAVDDLLQACQAP